MRHMSTFVTDCPSKLSNPFAGAWLITVYPSLMKIFGLPVSLMVLKVTFRFPRRAAMVSTCRIRFFAMPRLRCCGWTANPRTYRESSFSQYSTTPTTASPSTATRDTAACSASGMVGPYTFVARRYTRRNSFVARAMSPATSSLSVFSRTSDMVSKGIRWTGVYRGRYTVVGLRYRHLVQFYPWSSRRAEGPDAGTSGETPRWAVTETCGADLASATYTQRLA